MKHLSQTGRAAKLWSRMVAILCALFVVLSPGSAWAQNSVKGTVFDEAGEPIIGATVIVVGTQTGTSTDIDGKFMLQNIKKESVLQISFIGYQTVTVPVNGATNLKVELKSDSQIHINIESIVMSYKRTSRSTTGNSVQYRSLNLNESTII